MKRRFRQLIIIALVVIICVGVLSWPSVARYLIQSALQEARRGGHQLSWSGLSTGMKSVSFDTITVWVPSPRIKGRLSIPVSLELQELAVALDLRSLVALSPTITYETSLYGGSLKGTASGMREGQVITAHVEGVEVGKHPQLASLGVRGGAIKASFDRLSISPRGATGGSFSIDVRQLSLPLMDSAKTLLRVTDLGAFDLKAEGQASPQSVQFSNITVASRFGNATGNLTALNHISGAPNLSGTFKVSLSEQGATTLGPWLPLIPGAGFDASTTAFSVRVNSVPCGNIRGDSAVINIGTGCAKLSFSRG